MSSTASQNLAPGTRGVLVALAAFGVWFGFPNDLFSFPPAVLLWPISLALLGLNSPSAKKAAFHCWLGGFLGSCATLYWLCFPVIDVGELHWAPGALCAAFICACLSVFGAAFGVVAYWLREARPLAAAVVLSLFWYFLELLLSYYPAFPWLALCGALAASPVFIQSADLVGAYFTDALWIFAALAITFNFPAARGDSCEAGFAGACVGATMLAFLTVYGVFKIGEPPEAAEEVYALFVDGNINQNQKWAPEFQRKSLDTYLDLTRRGIERAREKGVENPLIIWPETSAPFFFERGGVLAADLRECAAKTGCPLLFGAPGLGFSKSRHEEVVYNRAFLLAPNGAAAGYYDKEQLVPFGEYLPSWLNFPFLEALLQGVGIYEEGVETAPLKYGPLALGVLICYEGIFPRLAQARVTAGANILVDLSNDGWFRGSPASRQHLLLTAPRCVEQNRWLLRCANTGASAVVDPRGRIVFEGPRFKASQFLTRAGLTEKRSVYHRAAPLIPGAAVVLLFAALFLGRKPKGGENS